MLWEGKQKKFKQKGYAVFVAFEGQCFYAILVQGTRQHCRTTVQQFWSFMASVSGLNLAAHKTWSISTFGHLNLLFWPPSPILRPDSFSDNNISFQIKVFFEWLICVSFEGAQIGVFRIVLLYVPSNVPVVSVIAQKLCVSKQTVSKGDIAQSKLAWK